MREEQRIISKETTIYIAEDGKEFESAFACEDYEFDLKLARKEAAIAPLKMNFNEVDWPSICDPDGPEHEYHWYKVCCKEDVKHVCEALSAYNRDFKDYRNILPYLHFETTYPDYICLVDFPHGANSPRWTTLSKLVEQSQLFMAQVVAKDITAATENMQEAVMTKDFLQDEKLSIKEEISSVLSQMTSGHDYRETSEFMENALYPYVFQIIEDDLIGQEEETGRLTVTEEIVTTAMMLYIKNAEEYR